MKSLLPGMFDFVLLQWLQRVFFSQSRYANARYEQEFEDAYDLFEVQRVLNNCFSYDLVPAPSVIQKALEACRRVNDYPTAVRTFEALKHKVENQQQYQAYLDELKDTRAELGIDLKEELYSEA